MNKILTILILFCLTELASGQSTTSPKYITCMLDTVTTSVGDTTFPAQPAKRWDSFTFYFTVDALYKIGAPDTTGFTAAPWLPIGAKMAITVGSATPLTRIAYKAINTHGQIVMLGTSSKR